MKRKSAPKAKVGRVARGKKPQYFSDPAIDKLLWITLTLMEELSVTRDRLDAVERLLDSKRLLALRAIEDYKPDAKTAALRAARRAAYIERVLRTLQVELEETSSADMPRSADEVVEAVES